MECPTKLHLFAAKRIFRYLKGTIDFGMLYRKKTRSSMFLDLYGFTDSDYAGDVDDRKSTSGYVFTMGSGAISWSSKKQSIMTLSTTEAKFVAATFCAYEVIDVVYYRSEDQIADIMTKPLKPAVFMKLRNLLGVYSMKEVCDAQVLE
ncbi:secreted RxLR effector protein 161-like [Pistacia vera]|uniref:secreted RxLR effector protein 161-like n=1 Tax=Pistacia vera TaxID=55513 RepID=UPI0012639185|nr:secreted RxLR effector protein 161-like [Pistacia vera]